MNEVIIAGIGQTPVGEHWDLSLRELALLALEQARQDSGNLQPQALYVGNMLSGILGGQEHLGAFYSEEFGLFVPAWKTEGACASGGLAFTARAQT